MPLPITRGQDFPGHRYAFGLFIVLNLVLFVCIAAGQLLIYLSVRKNSLSVAAQPPARPTGPTAFPKAPGSTGVCFAHDPGSGFTCRRANCPFEHLDTTQPAQAPARQTIAAIRLPIRFNQHEETDLLFRIPSNCDACELQVHPVPCWPGHTQQ